MIGIVATAYGVFILGVIGFQIALIGGAPWGRVTQGGQHDGALPVRGRVAAAVSILILLGFALSILSAAGVWPNWPIWSGWLTVGLQGLVMAANWATPSVPERNLWGPVTTIMFLLALVVMLGRTLA